MHPYEREQLEIAKLRNQIIDLGLEDAVVYRCINSYGVSEKGMMLTVISLSRLLKEQNEKIVELINNKNIIYAAPVTKEKLETFNDGN